ncbi:MAG: hypothetical protein M4579_007349 [Chaenotheca gracillima]|nr:MAG: hypothetical protein M4579_007349 [Chaenotheca gracillima]
MASQILAEFTEKDEAGNLTATYIESSAVSEKEKRGDRASRIDIIHPPTKDPSWQRIINIFLPAGYPSSVTSDYLEAVLQGVGVGDSSASASGAVLISVVHESVGRIATILFAHRLGTSLEPECKMYRLAADVFNDAAMILDCLSPVCPKGARVVLLSFSSVLRALCGVAAGSAKASLSAHFASWGNLGELNAAGSVVVSHVSSPLATWTWLILLLAVHLGTNYLAVRAVSMRSLNRQRANLVLSEILEEEHQQKIGSIGGGHDDSQKFLLRIQTPQEISRRERVFERDGVLRWKGGTILGYATIGVELRDIVSALSSYTSDTKRQAVSLHTLTDLYRDEGYMIWYDFKHSRFLIALKEGALGAVQLKAWANTLLAARMLVILRSPKEKLDRATGGASCTPHEMLEILKTSLFRLEDFSTATLSRLKDAGWDVTEGTPPALETRSGARFSIRSRS